MSAETRSASLPSDQSTKVSTNKATQLEIFALSPNTNYGYIDNLQVTLEKSVLANGQLEYHIHVSFAVEKNALSNVTVKLSDSRGSDSVHYSVLQVGSQSWDSKSFTTSERILNPGDSVTITGTVTITYTAMDNPTPTSTNSGSEIAGGPKKGEISTSYSFTVTYDDLMQDSRVHIQVIPEPSSSITTDQSVTFQLVITNNNPVPIYGHWDAGIEIPSGEGELSTTKHFLGGVMVNASQTVTITVATITYESAGDYKYSVTFSFGSSNNKTVSGVIHVSSDSGPAGSLEIKNVTPSSPSPKSGDVVNFTVKVRNAYLTKKDVEVKLFIDGKFADETGGSIPATSDMTFTLHWLAESGQHSYEVKLYSVDENGVKTLVGSWSGDLNVARDPNGLYAWLEVVPDKLKAGDSAVAFITIENTANCSQTWPVELMDNTGNVWWPKPDDYVLGTNYTLSKGDITIGPHRTAHIMVTDIELYQNTTFYLKVGGITMAMTYVEVKPANALKAFMDCGDMTLSAKSGELVFDMECDVHFTNPTDVKWNITRIDIDPGRILGTQRTRDVTIGIPAETIITRKVAPGGVGEFKLDYHGVLSESNLLKTGWDLKDLAGFKVPVQVNFTVFANGHPYVVTSNGTILGLGYTVTQYVTIDIEKTPIIEHIMEDIAIGAMGAYVGAQVGGNVGAIIGSAICPGVGTAAGMATGR